MDLDVLNGQKAVVLAQIAQVDAQGAVAVSQKALAKLQLNKQLAKIEAAIAALQEPSEE